MCSSDLGGHDMLDIKFVRDHIDEVQAMLEKRCNSLRLDGFRELEEKRRSLLSERSSVRYVRIGGAQRSSLLTSFLWSLVLAMLLVLFFFVAFPAIVMVMVGGLLLWAVVSIIGRGRIVSWVMRKMYGR